MNNQDEMREKKGIRIRDKFYPEGTKECAYFTASLKHKETSCYLMHPQEAWNLACKWQIEKDAKIAEGKWLQQVANAIRNQGKE